MKEKVKENFKISRIYGAIYELYNSEFGYQKAVLKGKLRLEDKDSRHPFVVGDDVEAMGAPGEEWVVISKFPRKNWIGRKSSENDAQILSANLDYLVIIASLKSPDTKEGFIDRCLASAHKGGVEPFIIFTKKDLATNEEIEQKVNLYANFHYKIKVIHYEDMEEIQNLRRDFQGKTVFFTGNSGGGKSTLINNLYGEMIHKTGDVSSSTSKGKHTTTNSKAIFLNDGTILIDSPGIKEWGVLNLTRNEIIESFPEFEFSQKNCKRSYCCDEGEGCEFNKESSMSSSRRKSMESMIDSLNYSHRITRRDHWKEGTKSKER
jgi:ribosome biogenesis GTPase